MDNSNGQSAPITVSPTPTPMSGSSDGSEQDRYRQVPVRVAILSAILLPMVLAPYLLSKRRTRILRHGIDELQNTTRTLQRELSAVQATLSTRKAESQGIEATLRSIVRETDALKHRVADLTTEGGAGRKDLDRLLAEAQHSRTQAAVLRALGSSLADIAAFMHEMELQIGIEPLSRDAQRRVDRLRVSALRLQSLPVTQQPAASKGEEPSAKPAGE